MGVFKDLAGQRFGRLVALTPEKDSTGRRYNWVCKCDCGNYVTVSSISLTTGNRQSCGCIHHEMMINRNTVHGYAGERLYKVWKGMKSRCYNPNHKSYPKYGGRGIGICEEWRTDYKAFRSWAYANGYQEDAEYQQCSLDRIDVDGNYEPSNCRWANADIQANNTRCVRKLTYYGKTKTITEWAKDVGIPRETLRARIDNGWDMGRALTTPLRK